jgi:hypothetical protein
MSMNGLAQAQERLALLDLKRRQVAAVVHGRPQLHHRVVDRPLAVALAELEHRRLDRLLELVELVELEVLPRDVVAQVDRQLAVGKVLLLDHAALARLLPGKRERVGGHLAPLPADLDAHVVAVL